MAVPKQKPGKSRQDYETPWAFVRAVERRIGVRFTMDLAANEANHKLGLWFGPGGSAPDALEVGWSRFLGPDGVGWLNPPYGGVEKWIRKARDEAEAGARLVMLVTAAVDTDYFAQDVWRRCGVVAVNGRIKFVGETHGHPKGSMLLLWGLGIAGFDVWTFAPAERADPPA